MSSGVYNTAGTALTSGSIAAYQAEITGNASDGASGTYYGAYFTADSAGSSKKVGLYLSGFDTGIGIVANTSNAFSIKAASDSYLSIVSTTSSESVTLGAATLNATVNVNSGTGTINVGSTASARTVNVATGAAAQTLTLGSTSSTSAATLQAGSGGLTLAAATGTLTITATGGACSVSIKDATTNAFQVKEGSNNYINVNTSDTQAVITLGNSTTQPFIDMGGTTAGALYTAIVGFTANAITGGVTEGDVLYLSTAGTVGKADADSAGKTFVVGIAAETASAGSACRVASLPGQIVPVSTNISAMAIGDVVFMSKTAGALTNDVSTYTTSGDTLYRVGFVHTPGAGAGDGMILYMPQFVQVVA
jgi:hypothetical protein